MTTQDDRSGGIDLAEVGRLVEALEQDLAQTRRGEGNLDALRAEVEQLRAALGHPGSSAHGLELRLQGLRAALHRAGDELVGEALAGSDYLARIGRMLGM